MVMLTDTWAREGRQSLAEKSRLEDRAPFSARTSRTKPLSMSTGVDHDEEQQRFVGELEGGEEYYLAYKYPENGVLVAYHTFVPTSQRGRGLGKKLCIACFEFAREHNILVEPTCSYIRDHFLKQNESYQKYVSKS